MNTLTRPPLAARPTGLFAGLVATPNALRAAHAAASTETAAPAHHASRATTGRRKTLQLAELLGDAQGIDIDHNGHVYRLQITKAGKLILTK